MIVVARYDEALAGDELLLVVEELAADGLVALQREAVGGADDERLLPAVALVGLLEVLEEFAWLYGVDAPPVLCL